MHLSTPSRSGACSSCMRRGCLAALGALAQRASQAQQPQPYTKWDQYGGSSDSMQYSALAQINKSNVKQLQRAWFYPVPGEPDRLQFNPLIVDNVMYVSGVRGVVVALDATTGKELWMSTLQATNRGLAYWESKDRSDRRLILTASSGIRELDARTGRQILTFGTNGFVDMRVGAPRRNGGPNSSPGRIFENLLIVGSNVGEGYGSPPGDIRAYDVLTGKLVWTFHTIPRPGEYGYETWPETAFRYAGGANTWGDLTLDEKNGIVFLPTGSPTHDLYGGDRQGDNLFGNCLLALDARTGKRLWHFQIVHHDLWDYDNAAAPKLLTVQHNGKPIDIVAQAGKTGFLYVFERKTGKPLWPIEERPVPKSEVPGEYSSPTQPFPTKPPPFARQSMTPEEVNPFVSPEEQEKLKQLVREAANEGVFTPSSHLRPHIQFPGAWGGANWGSVGRRSADRHGLRAQPRDDQLPQDVARRAGPRRRRRRRRWPRTGRRAARTARTGGTGRLHAALLDLPRRRTDADAIDQGARLRRDSVRSCAEASTRCPDFPRASSRTTRSRASSRI